MRVQYTGYLYVIVAYGERAPPLQHRKHLLIDRTAQLVSLGQEHFKLCGADGCAPCKGMKPSAVDLRLIPLMMARQKQHEPFDANQKPNHVQNNRAGTFSKGARVHFERQA